MNGPSLGVPEGQGAGAVRAGVAPLRRRGNSPDLEAGAGIGGQAACQAATRGAAPEPCRKRELGATGKQLRPALRSCSVAVDMWTNGG